MSQHSPHDSAYTAQAPKHPVSQLQGPFEESMLEAVDDEPEDIYLDPITRRNTLLEAPTYTRVVAGRWKQKPGERFHPLWKLIAQISFGVHLLAEGMAKSEDEVMQILQAHVDEIDGFLERTTEDFDLAQEDILERLRCLKLPLSHPATFDRMLEDRNFRLSIVEGNEKIEHIVERTSQAMKDSLKDVQKGFDSTSCLETYLQGLAATWQRQSVEHEAVFVAMLGNVEGWRKAFMSLHLQGNKLGGSLKKLTDIINEMQARAGEVSRRLLHQARVQHQQVMGRPTGRSTPTSRFQTISSKQLPIIQDRPALRQSASHDTVKTMPALRTSSQDSLRHHALLGRSQTPQQDMPAPRQVSNSASPRIIQIGSNSQARVQSMVPSLMEAATPYRETLVIPQTQKVGEEGQPERYFPPVELPAHVPEETMRTVPMSKQNRLSVGLGLSQAGKAEKRNSRIGTSALIDLLRSNPVSKKASGTPRSRSPATSRRTPTVLSDDSSSAGKPVASNSSPPRSSSVSDSTTMHIKQNKRQPKKGIQHWFDGLDSDVLEDDKYSVQEDTSSQVATTIVQKVQNASGHDSGPSTPSWAVTSFAQVEKKKELLKKGAFSSHPPDVPFGSPPLIQSPFQSPLIVTAPQRRPSHASSTGRTSLGEPGPEVAASEAGSVSGAHGRNNQAMKRASAYAPEVVVERVPPLPVAKKQFIAEMEGSSPAIPRVQQSSSSIRDVVMELEAPQQYFKLPPRPTPAAVEGTAKVVGAAKGPVEPNMSQIPQLVEPAQTAELEAYQQHFRLPPRPQQASPAPNQGPGLPQTSAQRHDIPVEFKEQGAPRQGQDVPQISSTIVEEKPQGQVIKNLSPQKVEAGLGQGRDKPVSLSANPAAEVVVEHFVDIDPSKQRLSSKVYVATPNVPLPPSPYGENIAEPQTQEPVQKPPTEEKLYFLPALAYKPPSPQLPPDPIFTRREAEPNPSSTLLPSLSVEPELSNPVQETKSASTAHVSPKPPSELLKHNSNNEPSPVLTLSTQVSASGIGDECDPYRASDHQPRSPSTVEPSTAKPAATTSSATLQRGHRPTELKDSRIPNPPDVHNPWKAFFTGQPSPVGSHLSIRSIKQESVVEQRPRSLDSPQSPALLSPTSVSSRHPFPPSPVASPDMASSAKEIAWINKSYDEARRSSLNRITSHEDQSSSEQEVKAEGLGITT